MIGNDRISEKLSTKQVSFIAAMLVSTSLASAAKETGISEITARRWLTLPHVKSAYDRAREEHFNRALEAVELATSEAVQALRECVSAEKPDVVRIRAATVLLQYGLETNKLRQLEQKMEELKVLLQEKGISI